MGFWENQLAPDLETGPGLLYFNFPYLAATSVPAKCQEAQVTVRGKEIGGMCVAV